MLPEFFHTPRYLPLCSRLAYSPRFSFRTILANLPNTVYKYSKISNQSVTVNLQPSINKHPACSRKNKFIYFTKTYYFKFKYSYLRVLIDKIPIVILQSQQDAAHRRQLFCSLTSEHVITALVAERPKLSTLAFPDLTG